MDAPPPIASSQGTELTTVCAAAVLTIESTGLVERPGGGHRLGQDKRMELDRRAGQRPRWTARSPA